MRILYLQCAMGASGDMLTAALASLLPDPAAFAAEIEALGIPGISAKIERAKSLGMAGWHAAIRFEGLEEDEHAHHHEHAHDHGHDHEHHRGHEHGHAHHHAHASLASILERILALPVSDAVKENACAVYERIARAEAEAHGAEPGDVHFHEVGTADAICDVVSVCLLMERLAVDRVVASPVCVGSGLVYCAHGFLPVPAPATARLLEGIPAYGSRFPGELCTPTGAALLAHFADDFGAMPAMTVRAQGCGIGTREFPEPNCLRVMLGDAPEPEGNASQEGERDTVRELCANIDDMTPEDLALARDLLLEAGALDAWVTPIVMKKGRMGSMLSALCHPEREAAVKRVFFQHTTTLGVRTHTCERDMLLRAFANTETSEGEFRVKMASGWGASRAKPEFDEVAAAVRKTGLPASVIRAMILDSEA